METNKILEIVIEFTEAIYNVLNKDTSAPIPKPSFNIEDVLNKIDAIMTREGYLNRKSNAKIKRDIYAVLDHLNDVEIKQLILSDKCLNKFAVNYVWDNRFKILELLTIDELYRLDVSYPSFSVNKIKLEGLTNVEIVVSRIDNMLENTELFDEAYYNVYNILKDLPDAEIESLVYNDMCTNKFVARFIYGECRDILAKSMNIYGQLPNLSASLKELSKDILSFTD